jgi:ribosomal-protein-alanine N-acetyltransferase
LRRLAVADLADFQRYRNDPDVGRWQGWKGMDDGAATGFLQEMADSDFCPPGRWFQLGIARRDSDQLIGDIGVHLHGGAGLLAELGFTLTPAAQGRGLATEAVGAALQMLLQHTPVQRIVAVADTRNAASLALLQRLGLRRFAAAAGHFWRPALRGGALCLAPPRPRAGAIAAGFTGRRGGGGRTADRVAPGADALCALGPQRRRIAWLGRRTAGAPSGGVTLALAHGRVVGVLALSTQADAHWIDQLYVHPAQGRLRRGCHVAGARAGLGRRPRRGLAGAAVHLPGQRSTHASSTNATASWPWPSSDGVANEERCPDVLYERLAAPSTMPA